MEAQFITSSPVPPIGVGKEEQLKLQRLKRLLEGAMRQNNKKLGVIYDAITSIQSADTISNETKSLCTILVEIREVRYHSLVEIN